MSGFLSWFKANFIIVILAILTIVPLPVAWYIAGGMNSKLREERQSEASKALRDVEAAKVTYTVPVLGANEQPISDAGPPNAAKTAFYREERQKREAMVAAVKERAVEFNAKNRGVLVEGLFPRPASGAPAQLLPFEMASEVLATGGEGSPSAYDELFRSLRIRPALDSELLRERVAALKSALMSQIAPGISEAEMEESARNQIQQQLVEQRLGALETHARDTSFYADESILPDSVPRNVPAAAPSLVTCFNWQADYWLISDVLSALAEANNSFDTNGLGGNVIDGVVKKVESIDFQPFVSALAVSSNMSNDMPVQPLTGDDAARAASRARNQATRTPSPFGGNQAAPSPMGVSFTGRGKEPSDLYDVRTVRVTLIASYAKLPALIDAISSYNFMTVTDADIYAIDPWDLISQGYYAGTDYPVRVELEIETLWLRSWTKQYMPQAVRQQLGIPEDEVSTEDEPA